MYLCVTPVHTRVYYQTLGCLNYYVSMLAQTIETLGTDLTLSFKVTTGPWAWKPYAVALLSVMCFLLGNTETFPLSTDQRGVWSGERNDPLQIHGGNSYNIYAKTKG